MSSLLFYEEEKHVVGPKRGLRRKNVATLVKFASVAGVLHNAP
jgi:hypothetical protein